MCGKYRVAPIGRREAYLENTVAAGEAIQADENAALQR
jgi:hypothetical protein